MTKTRRIELPETTTNRPQDIVIALEVQRVQLGIRKKQDLCERAGVRPEMYSYMLRRGRDGHELPADCLKQVQKALAQIQKEKHRRDQRTRP